LCSYDQTKESPVEKDGKPTCEEVPVENKDNDDNQDPLKASMEKTDTQAPTNTSSIRYSMPSVSTNSGQASSTQESQHDSDAIPEAEVGGSGIISVSSTSRLSASLGVQEEDFTNMQKFDPAGTLKLLLSKRTNQGNVGTKEVLI
jgi:hypothetical protein